MKNRIKQLRTKLALSQAQLAEKVGTSQQQIQRIESGSIAARVDLAAAICRALDKPIGTVFPGAEKALRKFVREEETEPRYAPRTETYTELSNAGVEAENRQWFLKVRLHGHRDEILFQISAADARRLFSAVQGEADGDDALSFIVFDTDERRVAINLRELAFCQFLHESPDVTFISDPESESETEERPSVQVFCSNNDCPLDLDADIDEGKPDDEEDEGEFRLLFYTLEEGGYAPHERLHFADGEGEDVFLRAGNLAMLDVALWVVDHSWYYEDNENDKNVASSSQRSQTVIKPA